MRDIGCKHWNLYHNWCDKNLKECENCAYNRLRQESKAILDAFEKKERNKSKPKVKNKTFPWPPVHFSEIEYTKAFNNCNIKTGDIVIVREKIPADIKYKYGWPGSWVNDMDSSVGKRYIVTLKTQNSFQLSFSIIREFPYYVLEKV